MALYLIFTLFLLAYADDGVKRDRRLLLNDPGYAQNQIQSIQATINDLNTKLTLYQNELAETKNHLSEQQLKTTLQQNINAQMEQKLKTQENNITSLLNHLQTQNQKLSLLEANLQQQETTITAYENKIMFQENISMEITKNLSQVMVHNFVDEMAETLCAAVTEKNAYVYALRRDCPGGNTHQSCHDICTKASLNYHMGDTTYHRVECFDAFHIQKQHNKLAANPGQIQTDIGVPFIYSSR